MTGSRRQSGSGLRDAGGPGVSGPGEQLDQQTVLFLRPGNPQHPLLILVAACAVCMVHSHAQFQSHCTFLLFPDELFHQLLVSLLKTKPFFTPSVSFKIRIKLICGPAQRFVHDLWRFNLVAAQ